MTSTDNLVRSVADVVSVEGWSVADGDKLSIHIDAVFRNAAVGGARDDPVRFRMSLERAELVAINPTTEDIIILPETVARDRIARNIKVVRTRNIEAMKSAGFLLKGHAGLDGMLADLHGEVGGNRTANEYRGYSEEFSTDSVLVEHRKGSDGMHRWEMFPADGTVLDGSGWDSAQKPRFSIQRPPPSRVERCLIFQVRCLREDIRIDEIEVVPKVGKPVPLFGAGERAKLAAAEAFIKTKLAEAGLISGDLNNRFAEICLLETIVEI